MTIIKKFDPVEPKKTLSKGYVILISLGLFILIVIEIWASNMIVNYGERYEKLSLMQQALNLENQILENNIAKQAALTSIASKSASLGFSRVESIQYIR